MLQKFVIFTNKYIFATNLPTMETSKSIGNNIAKFRNAQGFSQDQVAQLLGVSRGLVSLIETGEREISVTNLNKLADLFGIDLETLLEEDADVNKVHLAFAFRSDNSASDIESIAAFKRIVLDYLKMDKLRNALHN